MSGETAGEEIAIVGMAGRFPGADDVPTFWRQLVAGTDAVRDYTDEELRALGVDERLIADPDLVRAGGHVDGFTDFDATFFGMTADEARVTDPQHRLFLEQSWRALEDAGLDPAAFAGDIGVFAGCAVNRYFLFHLFANIELTGGRDPGDLEGMLVPHFGPDYLPAQAAYRLGLTGPAVAVQTACSSSLVAVAQAAQNLLDYRCDAALAGGASIAWPRHRYRRGGLVSRDGRCRAFSAAADGAAYSSGVAVVVLKRLADALDNGDQVHAILRGWAVNNDGARRAGFAAPGLDGQTAVVVEALASAGVDAGSIGYVEAHASGTPLGDAVEVAALTAAFASGAPRAGTCLLGSVKTNIGNLDAAAGAAALVKAVLAVREGIVPAHLHHDEPHPHVALAGSPFTVPPAATAWPGPQPRRAGVSSFGLGGTNCHVIIEQAPPPARERTPRPGWCVLPLSARTPAELDSMARRLDDFLAACPAVTLADIGASLALGRRAFAHRRAVLCRTFHEAHAGLAGHAALPDQDDAAGVALAGLAATWVNGGTVDWRSAYDPSAHQRVSLPGYPFTRRRHWMELASRQVPV